MWAVEEPITPGPWEPLCRKLMSTKPLDLGKEGRGSFRHQRSDQAGLQVWACVLENHRQINTAKADYICRAGVIFLSATPPPLLKSPLSDPLGGAWTPLR